RRGRARPSRRRRRRGRRASIQRGGAPHGGARPGGGAAGVPADQGMTTEAVTRYYAPQVRVIDAASGELVGATPVPGTSDGEPLVHFDVVSVRVTLVHTDVSQVQIVLNNKSFDGDGLPRVPPWKYNALDRITFGQRLRIEMTYGHQPWTKMILAQVNELQFGFGASGDQLTVIGEDLLSVLKRKPDRDKRYGRLPSEAQIVSDVVRSEERRVGKECAVRSSAAR